MEAVRAIIFLLCSCLSALALAQPPAPGFLCTRSEGGGELLTWANRDSDCGDYQATEIYRATSQAGPYTLLAELTDPDQTEYRDENPAGQRFFYFLRYRYDCPGSAPTSDTLDSFVPPAPVLDYISVRGDDLILRWSPSPAPEVSNYVILRVTESGVEAVDTVGLATSYTIAGALAGGGALDEFRYRVVAVDPCGNDSPIGNTLYPLGIDITAEECEGGVGIRPDYTALAAFSAFDSLRLYVREPGSSGFTERPFAVRNDSTLLFGDFVEGVGLCFILAVVSDGEEVARSPIACLDGRVAPPLRPFTVYGVELTDEGGLRFRYDPRDNRGVAGAGEVSIVGVGTVARNLAGIFTVNTLTVSPTALPEPGDSVRLTVTDSCGRREESNGLLPVWLAAERLTDRSNRLRWTAFANGLPGSVSYTVRRIDRAGNTTVLADGLSELSFIDTEALPNVENCYQILANFSPAADSGVIGEVFSFQSNRVCVSPRLAVYVPNAFSPTASRAENRELRPFFRGDMLPTEYSLRIYDRWGGLVFESNDPSRGWSGEVGGRAAMAGAYVYVLSFGEGGGNLSQRTGVVQLLY